MSAVRGDSGSYADELVDQYVETVERIQVAEKLRRQLFLFDDALCDPRPLRCFPEPAPGLLTRALQIVDGDVTIRSRGEIHFEIQCASIISAHQTVIVRLVRPVFRSSVTTVFTTRVGLTIRQILHAPLD